MPAGPTSNEGSLLMIHFIVKAAILVNDLFQFKFNNDSPKYFLTIAS